MERKWECAPEKGLEKWEIVKAVKGGENDEKIGAMWRVCTAQDNEQYWGQLSRQMESIITHCKFI